MTSALIVSRSFPDGPEKVHGIYQRLGTQVQALAQVVDRVDCLFLVRQSYPTDLIRGHEERLRRLWSPRISLLIAPTVAGGDMPSSWWRVLAEGMFDFQRQPIARYSSTPAAIEAVGTALDARPDVVLAHRLTAMSVLMKIARRSPQRLQGIPVFFDMDDIEHVSLVRHLLHDPAWRSERLLLLQVPALLFAEIQAVRLAATTFVCSEADRRSLARLSGTSRVQIVPNSVTFPALVDGDVSEPLVLFVGGMDYRPNAQAADSLVRDIWPAVQARVPAARLAIIGPGREHTRAWRAADESVMFTGYVDDLQSWYRRARVVCCPIYHGGGTRMKIIEAAAYARAIVSTRLGAEGLNFEDERELILRDNPADLAAACVRLLQDPQAAVRLGRAAMQKARSTYERAAVVDRLASTFRTGHADTLRQRGRV